jgi:hypothetical protein
MLLCVVFEYVDGPCGREISREEGEDRLAFSSWSVFPPKTEHNA